MKIKAIITGTTGMVGKGVLLEFLDSPEVETVLVINRSSLEMTHPKLKEILHADFHDFSSIKSELQGYNMCCHCMGVSSAGISEEAFHRLTSNITDSLATTLREVNHDMVFIYVSGAGTDTSEKGKVMWARVKGKTENRIFNLKFKDAYAFRPGAIIPLKGVQSKTSLYRWIYLILTPLFPLLKRMKSVTTTVNIGQAMLHLFHEPVSQKRLEGADINQVSQTALPHQA